MKYCKFEVIDLLCNKQILDIMTCIYSFLHYGYFETKLYIFDQILFSSFKSLIFTADQEIELKNTSVQRSSEGYA